MSKQVTTIEWKEDKLFLLDQTVLPNVVAYQSFDSIQGVWDAIQDMIVRGAPAIGVAAAYGMYLGAESIETSAMSEFQKEYKKLGDYLATSRPTAVNLSWAIDRMIDFAQKNDQLTVGKLKEQLLEEAKLIHKEDEEINYKIGENMLSLLSNGCGLLTHCNAGALATTKYGTATAAMYLAQEKNWDFKVYSDETRPRLQGSNLTAFELHQAGIDVTVITDSMAAVIMSKGEIDAIIVGADRVAANGDVANKIGTLNLSILAKNFNIPMYIAVPTPTIDMQTKTGAEIPIEERDSHEVIKGFGEFTAPKDVKVFNPAFDVTPHENITAIVTEKGIVRAPFEENLKKLFE
ncbi:MULTISPECIES: S-methyl-5-thioribose-1-phosphate isomerase [Sporosarcina]|uniref:S-methyl-5-thioribose-1-phosphate isomerase n=1 Tax=Sporosarcina TaxID=1569 RepID=UPI001C8CF447|nr:S-methyl-5-thioribose-1-phosphate isomerase [Sporosarcina aquimarina]MBY0223882.1 S-methyl-5-thioribose-1-phosphate isomerase [Sporosarcina aquimarina]